jgi:hypothetical protein
MEPRNDYVREWLGVYLDGALSDDRRAWVEDHLKNCPACRKELAELRALTNLLHADPAPEISLDEAAFTGQVLDRLSGQGVPRRLRALRFSLRYAPLGLFGVWAFTQAVILVSAALLQVLAVFPQAEEMFTTISPGGSGGVSSWLGSILSLSGLNGPDLIGVQIPWLNPLALIFLAVLVINAVLFLAWLSALWSYRRAQAQ